MNNIIFQKLDSYTSQEDNICKFVTSYYLREHVATHNVYKNLTKSRQEIFERTFEKAMRISLSVLDSYRGDFYLVQDKETNNIVGFTMGMAYRPSVKPLTTNFFAETQKECPEFFQIFAEAMPLMMKYEKINDADLDNVLNGKQVYYLGMTGSVDTPTLIRLVSEVTQHVFSPHSPFIALYTLSSGNHESDLVQKFQDKGLQVHRFGANAESPHTFIALIHPPENQIAEKVVELYTKIEKSHL